MTSEVEQTFLVELSETELILLVGLCWCAERNQILQAQLSSSALQRRARMKSAAKALALSEKLAYIGGAA